MKLTLSSEHLHTLTVFAQDTNLSRAARRLHLSQPAVHAQLKALADNLGVPLYQRVGRGLALTKEGVAVLAFARDQAERTRELMAHVRGETDDAPVVLAAGAGALVHLLADGLRAFTRARGSRLEVVTADASQAADLVRSGLAHVGVGVLDARQLSHHGDLRHATQLPELDVHELARAAQVLVMPRGHRLAKRRTITLSDLAGEAVVAPPEGGPQRAALTAALTSAKVEVHVSAVARGWDVVLKLVELGVGLGIVNATCAIPRRLVARPLRELPSVTYLAFTRPHPREAAVDLVRALVAGASTRA